MIDQTQETQQLAAQMTLLEHLDELRVRLIRVSIAILVTTLLSFIFSKFLVEILARPLPEGINSLESIDVTENISVFMRVSLASGIILAMPIILYQIIAFIVPGLTSAERRFLYFTIPPATLLFLLGVAFAYFIMLPTAIPFLIGFLDIPTQPRPSTYFGFVSRLILWIGLSFELPIIMGLLARLGIITPNFLVRNLRYAIVIIAILAALITPTPDPINMGLAMTPLLLLYLLGIILARVMYRPRE
ncbi:MAG: twin-arginine translocase subunit TatC [Anaerolineae bacterium]